MKNHASPGSFPWLSLVQSKPVLLLLSIATLILILVFWERQPLHNKGAWPDLPWYSFRALRKEAPDPHRANSTLGFQIILAVSGENRTEPGAWRQEGLRAAAERSGLQIQIHQQSTVTAKELIDFRGNGGVRPGEGSALAWMGHIETLRYIIDHQISTALVLEDDADWDIHIRKVMAPKAPIAFAFRQLYGASNNDLLTKPFGTRFDVLWLGHCGASKTDRSRQVVVQDDTLLPSSKMRALWGPAYEHLGNHRREVFSDSHASCTYAYAVTLKGARRMLQTATQGGAAFDNVLADGCGANRLDCSSLGPELFHQMRRIGDTSLIDAITNKLKGKKVGHHQGQKERYFTHNIKYSSRCNAGHAPEDLVQCLPTDEEFKKYAS